MATSRIANNTLFSIIGAYKSSVRNMMASASSPAALFTHSLRVSTAGHNALYNDTQFAMKNDLA